MTLIPPALRLTPHSRLFERLHVLACRVDPKNAATQPGNTLHHACQPSLIGPPLATSSLLRETMIRTMELFRKYCLGDDPVRIQVLSDQTMNFSR